jgi:hypothetical protein
MLPSYAGNISFVTIILLLFAGMPTIFILTPFVIADIEQNGTFNGQQP